MIRFQPLLSRWQSHLLPRAVAAVSKSSVADVKPADEGATGPAKSNVVEAASKKEEPSGPYKSKLVATVFASLNDSGGAPPRKTASESVALTKLEQRIKEAKDVETLLKIAATPNLSRKAALSILSIFGDWTSENKIKLSDFESDVRFLAMCRVLSQDLRGMNGLGDLATVLGVTGDDEAAKLISSASLSQMVRIIEKLSSKKKRSPPVLRSLAFNISKSEEKMNIKQCADVLFAMANLSFYDEVLLLKTCSDAYTSLTKETKSSVVGSIARSLGILRYRDTALLDRMAEWLVGQTAQARPQDVVSILMALATVDYQPSDVNSLWKAVIPTVTPLDLPTSGLYLDAVWSLLLLEKQTNEQVAMALSSDFIEKLRKEDGSNLSMSAILKLLNINATAESLLTNYKGPRLNADQVPEVALTRPKDKLTLVNCVMDSLLNLLPGENFLKRDINSGAGFIIVPMGTGRTPVALRRVGSIVPSLQPLQKPYNHQGEFLQFNQGPVHDPTTNGECLLDSSCTPLPLTSPAGKKATRVAIMVLGYHDTCVGARFHGNGVQAFSRRLLEARGYRVLSVLHSEFSPASKLVQRVQYLEQKLKALVSG